MLKLTLWLYVYDQSQNYCSYRASVIIASTSVTTAWSSIVRGRTPAARRRSSVAHWRRRTVVRGRRGSIRVGGWIAIRVWRGRCTVVRGWRSSIVWRGRSSIIWRWRSSMVWWRRGPIVRRWGSSIVRRWGSAVVWTGLSSFASGSASEVGTSEVRTSEVGTSEVWTSVSLSAAEGALAGGCTVAGAGPQDGRRLSGRAVIRRWSPVGRGGPTLGRRREGVLMCRGVVRYRRLGAH